MKEKDDVLSVILTFGNDKNSITGCMNSIITQSLSPAEVLCIDIGAKDGTRQIIAEYMMTFPYCKMIDMMGMSADEAKQVALAKSKGKYVFFANAKDWYEPSMFEEMVGKIQREASCIVCCARNTYDARSEEREYDYSSMKIEKFPEKRPFSYKDFNENIFNLIKCWNRDKIYDKNFLMDNNITFHDGDSNDFSFAAGAILCANRISVVNKAFVTIGNASSELEKNREPMEDVLCAEEDAILVSVIIPTLNSEQYIQECVESVMEQTHTNIEIICVDAGSRDRTCQIINELQKKDTRISLVYSEKKSYGYQVNMGIGRANGKYIGIVESDDYINADMYESLVRVAERNNLEVVKADFKEFAGEEGSYKYSYRFVLPKYRSYYDEVLNIDNAYRCFVKNYSPWPWAGIYKRDFLIKNNIAFNETDGASYQDNGFWMLIISKAKRIYFLNKYFYNLRRDNINSSTASKEKVFCIKNEFDYVDMYYENNKLPPSMLELSAYHRYFNYIWNLERIDDKYKEIFIKQFSEDFRMLKAKKKINENLFGDNELRVLNAILKNPLEGTDLFK